MMSGENRRGQIAAIAGSVLVHLVLFGALVTTELAPVSGGPGVLEVFVADSSNLLFKSESAGSEPLKTVTGKRRNDPDKDPQAKQEKESKPVRPSSLEISEPPVILDKTMTQSGIFKEEGRAESVHRDEESRSGETAGAPPQFGGREKGMAELKKDALAHSVAPGTFYFGEFGGKNGPSFHEQVQPAYPHSARRRGKEGNVLLKLIIDQTGQLTHVEVVKKAGFGFDQAAVKAIRQSTFLPATVHGKHVKVEALLPIRFVLQ